jgi:hypothetical protein
MNTPRFNRQQCFLPQRLIPEHLNRVYKDILKDAGLLRLYNAPLMCLQETLLGVGTPGIHLKLIEQTQRAGNGVSVKPMFFPKNANNSMTRPDNELKLTFRHIDGFHNYWMLFFAVNYSQNHLQQKQNNEQFIDLGKLAVDYFLTDNYTIRMIYTGLVYESIEGFDSKFSSAIAAQQFTVNCKFRGYQTELWLGNSKVLGSDNILVGDTTSSYGYSDTLEGPEPAPIQP